MSGRTGRAAALVVAAALAMIGAGAPSGCGGGTESTSSTSESSAHPAGATTASAPASSTTSTAPRAATGASAPHPTGAAPAAESVAVYRVRDSGIRCVTYPCPSIEVRDMATGVTRNITGLDLAALDLTADATAKTYDRILAGQALARGTVRTVPDQGPAGAGTVLFVTGVLAASN